MAHTHYSQAASVWAGTGGREEDWSWRPIQPMLVVTSASLMAVALSVDAGTALGCLQKGEENNDQMCPDH